MADRTGLDRGALYRRLEDLSPEQRALLTRLLQGGAKTSDAPRLAARSRHSGVPLPCSFAQQRLWFLDRLEPGNPAYIIVTAPRLNMVVDAEALERSLQDVVQRHEVLRTTFAEINGEPVQVIAPQITVPLQRVDLSDRPPAAAEAAARELAAIAARQSFDLTRGPLLRATLLRLAPDDHILLLAMHHIVTDGWSMGVLFEELTRFYSAHAVGVSSDLPNLPLQYADFAMWQREWLAGPRLSEVLAYWRNQLAGLPQLELPTDRPRPPVKSARGATVAFEVPPPLAAALQDLARREGVTLFMTLLAAFATLLGRYSGQVDVAVGSPMANRMRAELEGLIGFFVNTLVLPVSLAGAPSFRTLLARVKAVALGAYAHQDLPFERLVEELQPRRDLSRNPLFDVMIQLQRGSAALRDAAADGSPALAARAVSVFDLSLDLWEGDGCLSGQFEYSTDLFEPATIRRMTAHFITLMEAAAADPDRPVTSLPLLTQAERQQLLVDWNATAAPVPPVALHTLVDRQAARTPAAIAVHATGVSLTYDALVRRANQLAHVLRTRGIVSDSLVAVCLDRSVDLIVALLGVLKAGGAFLPIEPSSPPARLAAVLAAARPALVLTRSALAAALPQTLELPRLCLDTDCADDAAPQTTLDVPVDPRQLAYVIYTSGSTGVPKGVEIEHRAVVNHALAMGRELELGPRDRVLQFASLNFDVAVEEIFPALLHGAEVSMASEEAQRSPEALVAHVREHGITVVNLPTPVWEAWMPALDVARMPTLRLMIVGSEQMPAASYAAWMQMNAGRVRLVHAFGVTEATITSLTSTLDSGSPSGDRAEEFATVPPIGRPIANTEAYVLDAAREPVPVGVPGELHLGGWGLARGYRRRPDLTAERFGPHPFRPAPARLYGTGDRVRWRPDGQLEFLGRLDDQIKLHGFRIEPAEIEAALRRRDGVRDARVLRREDSPGAPRLVAYLVSDGLAARALDHELTAFLRDQVPAYMLPAAYVWLPRLPLTPHGKLDRDALPAPVTARPSLSTQFVVPRTRLERTIATVWREVLQVPVVGRDDNFFDLGGRSLLLMRVHALMTARLPVAVSVLDLFRYPTVSTLAAHLADLVPSEEHALLEPPAALDSLDVGHEILDPFDAWSNRLPASSEEQV